MKNSLVLLLAGSGKRLGLKENKALLKIHDVPLYMYSLNTFYEAGFRDFILVISLHDYMEVKEYISTTPYKDMARFVLGGDERYLSVKNAIREVKSDIVFIHDAARPCVNINDINSLIIESKSYPCGSLVHPVIDTLRNKLTSETIDRNPLVGMETPQFFDSSLFRTILDNDDFVTDEISLFKDLDIAYVMSSSPNPKLTYPADLEYINYLLNDKTEYRIGHSLDYHPFKDSGNLILGGITFSDYPLLDGHSDADVLYHAVTESILGAAGLGDLGTLYPDTDMKYKGIDSSLLLKDTINRIKEKSIEIENIDCMVYLIKPNLKDYKALMAKNIKELTGAKNVTVKAATLNKKGLIATSDGIGAEAHTLIKILK